MSGELFTFADEREWPTPRLHERFTYLQQRETGYLSEERLEQIRVEMANIAFEGLMRSREKNQREEEVKYLEDKFETLATPGATFTVPKMPWRKQGQ